MSLDLVRPVPARHPEAVAARVTPAMLADQWQLDPLMALRSRSVRAGAPSEQIAGGAIGERPNSTTVNWLRTVHINNLRAKSENGRPNVLTISPPGIKLRVLGCLAIKDALAD